LFQNRAIEEAEKWRVFEAVSTVLGRTLSERAGVLIFDNLHFAHALGLEFLSFVLRNHRMRILFIFLARSSEATQKGHICQQWLGDLTRSGCEMLKVAPLEEKELRGLVEAIFGRIDAAERDLDKLWKVSQGNPYYIGEIIRLLLNEGKLTLGDD